MVPRTHPSLRGHVINIVTHQSCLQVPQRRMGLVNNAPTALRFYWLIDLFGYLRIKIIEDGGKEMRFFVSTKNCVWKVKSGDCGTEKVESWDGDFFFFNSPFKKC